MNVLRIAFASALLFAPALAAGAQKTVPTSPGAQPLKVVLELVNDPDGAPSGSPIESYVAALSNDIQSRWLAQLGSGANRPLPDGQETLISVTILPDGKTAAAKMMHATHDNLYDKAAFHTLRDAAFAPLPSGLPKPDLKLRVHFMVQRYDTQPGPS